MNRIAAKVRDFCRATQIDGPWLGMWMERCLPGRAGVRRKILPVALTVLAVLAQAFFPYQGVAAANTPSGAFSATTQAANISGGDPGFQSGRYIVRLKPGTEKPLSLLSRGEECPVPVPYAQGYFVAERLEDVQGWLDLGIVDYAVPDAELKLLADEPWDDRRLSDQWYLDLMEVPAAWGRGLAGGGVTVAVIDSGVYRAHEDLDYDKIQGYSFLGLPEHFDSYDDRTGHGTFVTGLVAALAGNGKGIAGLSSEANILSLRCFSNTAAGDYDAGSGSVSAVLSAVGYAIEHEADVINMSFGGASEALLLPLKEKLQEAADEGIILVAAAGNDGNDTLIYPAAYDFVIGVGMVDKWGIVDPRSQRNESVFVAAPGSGVLSLGYALPSSYSAGTGTSYAAPMVTAMAAMVKQVNPAIDSTAFAELLRLSSVDQGDEGYDIHYGWGLVNASNLADLLSWPYQIAYESGGGNIEGEPGVDYPVAYTLDREEPAVFPVPQRQGHTFLGWFDNPDFDGEAVISVPPKSVGDLTFYAKWLETSTMVMSRIAVLGVEAALDPEDLTGMTYVAEVPSGTQLEDITAGDIVAEPANGMPAQVEAVPGSGGAAWTLTFETMSGHEVTYLLWVVVSDNAAPAVAESQESQLGTAIPASYDLITGAVSYTADMSGWFTDDGEDLCYIVTSSDGFGVAELDGVNLTMPGRQ